MQAGRRVGGNGRSPRGSGGSHGYAGEVSPGSHGPGTANRRALKL
jgi:hypothetical protein